MEDLKNDIKEKIEQVEKMIKENRDKKEILEQIEELDKLVGIYTKEVK